MKITKKDIQIYDPSDFGTYNNNLFCICANCDYKTVQKFETEYGEFKKISCHLEYIKNMHRGVYFKENYDTCDEWEMHKSN